MPRGSFRKPARTSPPQKKEPIPPAIRLAQEEEIQQLIARFQSQELHGGSVAQLEVLVRTAVFKSPNALVGWLLQQIADFYHAMEHAGQVLNAWLGKTR